MYWQAAISIEGTAIILQNFSTSRQLILKIKSAQIQQYLGGEKFNRDAGVR